MEGLIAVVIGTLTATGVYLTLRDRTFSVVLGLVLLSYGVNLFLFSMGRLATEASTIITQEATTYSDTMPQSLVLTAIVIGFGMTSFLIVLSLKANNELGTDHVDGLTKKVKK